MYKIYYIPLSRHSRSGLLAITDVLFDGMGIDGFGLVCMAAKACCTASCRTSVNVENIIKQCILITI